MKQKVYLCWFVILEIALFSFTNCVKIDLKHMAGFKCFGVTGLDTPIRLSDTGDVECFSFNGKDCLRGMTHDTDCKRFVVKNKDKLQPLQCGEEFKQLWGIAGYDDANHFCAKGRKYFYNKWHCPQETGHYIGFRMNFEQYKIECLSIDGKKCLKGRALLEMCNKVNCDTNNTMMQKIVSKTMKMKPATPLKSSMPKKHKPKKPI